MSKSIFVGSESNIARVYSDEVTKKLADCAGLDDKTVYTKESLLADTSFSEDAEYVFSTWGMPHFTKAEIEKCFPKLKGVFYAAGTVQGFAREFLESNVQVFSAWAANAVPVAEYVTSQIILANKGFFRVASECSGSRKGYDLARSTFAAYPGNYGCRVGIIGAGIIGRMVIESLKAHKIDVCVYDPFLPEDKAEQMGAIKCSLKELFESCITVSNHVANNPQTVGMINYSFLSRLPQGASFINTGRGAQVVEADLIRVMTERPDLTAVLDVTLPEPPEETSALYSLKNVILTPHMAGSSGLEVIRMSEYMLEEYKSFSKGEPTRYSVSLKMLETMA